MKRILALILLITLWAAPAWAEKSAAKYHPGDVEAVNNILRLIQKNEYNRLTITRWAIGRPETWKAPAPGPTIDERLSMDERFYSDSRGVLVWGIVWRNGRVVTLDLNFAELTGVVDLTGLTELEVLKLNNNRITGLKGLNSLSRLTELNLSHNQIADLGDLGGLKKLRWLNLSQNQLTGLKGLDQLKNLRWLDLGYNQLTALESLADLTQLEGLHLGRNQLTALTDLDRLKNLRFLYLYSNQFTALDGYGGLKNLRALDLSRNRLTRLEGLGQLQQLRQLNLGGNDLSAVPGLDQLTNLTALFLEDAQVADLGDLSPLTRLEVMRIANNRLTRLDGLEKLIRLRILYLNGNSFPPNGFLGNFNTGQLTNFDFSGHQLPVFSLASEFKNLKRLGIADAAELQSVDLAGRALGELDIYDYIAPEKFRNPGDLDRLVIMRDSHYRLAEVRELARQFKISEILMLLRSQTVTLGDAAAGLKAGRAYAPAEVSPALAAEYAGGADQATILIFTQKDRQSYKQPIASENPPPKPVGALGNGRLTFTAPGDYYLSISFAPHAADQYKSEGFIHYQDVFTVD